MHSLCSIRGGNVTEASSGIPSAVGFLSLWRKLPLALPMTWRTRLFFVSLHLCRVYNPLDLFPRKLVSSKSHRFFLSRKFQVSKTWEATFSIRGGWWSEPATNCLSVWARPWLSFGFYLHGTCFSIPSILVSVCPPEMNLL